MYALALELAGLIGSFHSGLSLLRFGSTWKSRQTYCRIMGLSTKIATKRIPVDNLSTAR
jgi:hypothetical protein